MRRLRDRLVIGVALVAVAALSTGCRADAVVDVRMSADGTGRVAVTVELDDKAADLVGEVALDGLRERGWRLAPVEAGRGGGAIFRATKSFDGAAQAQAVLAEVGAGLDGVRVTRRAGTLSTRTEVEGAIDWRDFAAVMSDADLAQALGRPLGVDGADLEAALGGPVDRAFSIRVRLDLPGRQKGTVSTEVRPGELEQIAATSTRPNYRLLVPLAALVVLAVAVPLSAVRAHRRAGRLAAIDEI